MTGGFRFITTKNYWCNSTKITFFLKKAILRQTKPNLKKFEKTNNRLNFVDPRNLRCIFDP